MIEEPPRPRHLFRWFETMRRPGLFMAVAIFLLYGRTLTWGFFLDDFHHIQILEEYHAGHRPWTPLYRFLSTPEGNAAARKSGEYAWWIGSDVRYGHWRPVAERLLYWQYTQFGRNPLGYRIVNLALYTLGVLLVLALFRRLSADERLARWGALAFAVFTAHTIPVIFISAQADPLSLVLVALGLLAALDFCERTRVFSAILASACFVLALGTKESCLLMIAAPILFVFFCRGTEPESRRERLLRAATLSGAWALVGATWLYHYLKSGYGSNALLMLNPGSEPLVYLAEFPIRAMALLTSMALPINPFLFYLFESGRQWMPAFCAYGLIVFLILGRHTIRAHLSRPGVAAMTLWTLLFLPLLVCTVPDDRVLMLPTVGFAFVVGAWISGDPRRAVQRPAGWALVLCLSIHPPSVIIASQIMRTVEKAGARAMREAVHGFGRELKPGDSAFFINSTLDSNVLFVQPRFEAASGRNDVHAAFLSDLEDPVVRRVDSNTLRISAREGHQFFTGFLGGMSASRERPKREGLVFESREFTARLLRVETGRVKEVELTFRRPLDSEQYRFYRSGAWGQPVRWELPKPETTSKPETPAPAASAARGAPSSGCDSRRCHSSPPAPEERRIPSAMAHL